MNPNTFMIHTLIPLLTAIMTSLSSYTIYMDKNINVTLLLVFGIPFGICFIIVIITLIDYCCEKYKKKNDSDDKQFINGEPYLEFV